MSKPVALPLPGAIARQVSYYKAYRGPGVLAPRGWRCFCVYGSSGSTLFVTPDGRIGDDFFNERRSITGPVIKLAQVYGDTGGGRILVAQTIARAFPMYLPLARETAETFDLGTDALPDGPYPMDKLVRRTTKTVEYETPPHAEGLGTSSGLNEGDLPIRGIIILDGSTPDLLLLAVRLPEHLAGLTPTIIEAVKRASP